MENGSNVTRAELQAHLDPIQADINEVKHDVKALLLTNAAASAAASAVRAETKDRGARKMAFTSLIAACIGSLWWVQDAIAKLTH